MLAISSFSFLLLLRSSSSFSASDLLRPRGPFLTSLPAATTVPMDAPVSFADEEDPPRVGVLMLNLGGPETGDDVEGVSNA